MRRLLFGFACWLCVAGAAAAQDATLTAQDTTVTAQTNLYGQQIQVAEGALVNESGSAYSAVTLYAEVYDADGQVIGEGFGYLVNACGAGLLPDFALQPGSRQAFAIPLELDEEDLTIDRVDVTAQGTASDAAPVETPVAIAGITPVSSDEIASVEWIDEDNLRFGAGCRRDLYNAWTWNEYNLSSGDTRPVEYANNERVTPALRLQLGLENDLYFRHSMLSFPPDARRMVYQNEINSFYSAEPDGSFKRLMLDKMSTRTLQKITWLKNGAFLASYYGAYGDPVYYFTGDVEGKVLSERPENNPASLITPGATPDGARIILAAEQDGKTGYYLKRAAYPGAELLFESDVPGNNWPGPLVEQDADGTTFIYTALPDNDGATLACFNMVTRELHDLSPLPLTITTEDRATWVLSPENNTIALAADGVNGGLWLIDLAALPSCE
ncbi:MAG: FxLYD domain-containing protein [Anaerolineae bacterium]|nr:FxLYD domain-containing protein [Anaerolineae bacterium]